MHYKHINKSLLVVWATREAGKCASLLVLFWAHSNHNVVVWYDRYAHLSSKYEASKVTDLPPSLAYNKDTATRQRLIVLGDVKMKSFEMRYNTVVSVISGGFTLH